MKNIQSRSVICTFVAVAALLAAPLMAGQSATPAPGLSAALAADAGVLSDKFIGLARVMSGKYDWKPGQGVRSVGDVLNLIVMENKMLTGLITGAAAAAGPAAAPITDPAQMQDALRSSYAAMRQALAGMSAADLAANVKFFGQDTTKQGAAMMLLSDQHEHLGQSIAYARTNGVVPPWSK